MAPIPVALPEHLQTQSRLVSLPTEIKHIIFSYCLVADGPFVDPIVGCIPPKGDIVPKSGISVLQTCRRIYHETDRRPLIVDNTFRFTTVDRAQSFFRSIEQGHGARVQDIEIDVRRLHSDILNQEDQWLDYLASGSTSLCKDAPGLKCLRLNFASWPLIPVSRKELWKYLGTMLSLVGGLERVVLVGASKGQGMAMQEPWSSVHFVGGDDVGSGELVPRMWNAVKDTGNRDKMIRWERHGGNLYLEVVSRAYLAKHVDSTWTAPCTREKCTDPWPENGSCTLSGYLDRHSDCTAAKTDGLNPSAAG